MIALERGRAKRGSGPKNREERRYYYPLLVRAEGKIRDRSFGKQRQRPPPWPHRDCPEKFAVPLSGELRHPSGLKPCHPRRSEIGRVQISSGFRLLPRSSRRL